MALSDDSKVGTPATRATVSFADVAGADDAKAQLSEIVDFLRDGRAFAALGARMPRGVLLSGPTGTGKTLLARAVAGEASVPFLSCSASDFVECLVGRGAARVRELFARARALAPCVVFVDEIDALAKARGGFNSNDEREQTLNQLLCEMDGFDAGGSGSDPAAPAVLVLAATNRPEILDKALVRPGRFDRYVTVGKPDAPGRAAILRVHARRYALADAVDLDRVAAAAPGWTGAELENALNEAAFRAARDGAGEVEMRHVAAAVEAYTRSRGAWRDEEER